MKLNLTLSFLSYWHSGSGLGDGAGHDAAVIKDRAGLPYFPGKALKGVLRNAVNKAASLGWYAHFAGTNIEELLFGTSHLDEDTERLTSPGTLYVSSAELAQGEKDFLAQAENSVLRTALFTTLASTAVDYKTGTAVENSLRSIEVVVPVTLYAEITFAHSLAKTQHAQVLEAIELALPLIEQIGGKRSRGLGKVAVSVEVSHAG